MNRDEINCYEMKIKHCYSRYGYIQLSSLLNREHGVKYHIPYLTGHSESELEVLIVVSEMILLHCSQVRWKLRVVQGVVHAVVQNIKREGSRDNAVCHGRRKDSVRQLGEWSLERRE